MEKSTCFPCLILLSSSIALTLVVTPVNGQSRTICTEEMIRSFTPCISFLMRSSNTSPPSSECCNSLRDLMSNGQDCLCFIATGGAPFEVPLNRTLVMSLPRACRMSGVPIECRAAPSPRAAPAPQNRGEGRPNMSPRAPPPTPRAPFIPQVPQAPPPRQVPQAPPLPPPFEPRPGSLVPPPAPPSGNIVPFLTPPGKRPTLTPSASHPGQHSGDSFYSTAINSIIVLFLII